MYLHQQIVQTLTLIVRHNHAGILKRKEGRGDHHFEACFLELPMGNTLLELQPQPFVPARLFC